MRPSQGLDTGSIPVSRSSGDGGRGSHRTILPPPQSIFICRRDPAYGGDRIPLQEINYMTNSIPRVGVGVAVIKDGKVLFGKRKGSHGEGSWSFPGGHVEFGESLEDCASREVLEETGIRIKNIQKFAFTNDIFEKENKHYITCFLKADYDSGELVNKEPEKLEEWQWFDWSSLPQPLFLPIQHLIEEKISPLA